jgi:monoamine oxidase
VEVATETHQVFEAAAAVITLPLGVLQARRVTFVPQPVAIFDAADRLAMGTAARVVYEFDGAFWSHFTQLKDVSFVFAPEASPPTWWTTNPWPDLLLTGWVAGRKVDQLNIAELPEIGLTTLARLLGSELPELRKHLVRWHQHDWKNDAYSLGSYTYVPRGAIHASDELSVPVEKTLFFAGEHTDTSGHWGTVHGALRSAYRAAEQVRLCQISKRA